MAIYIAPAAMGLGDLVVTLPVVQQLIAVGEPVYLVVRLPEHVVLGECIPGLAGVILEWQMDGIELRRGDRFYNLRDHFLQRQHWWGSRQFVHDYPGVMINDLLKIICRDFDLAVEFDLLQALPYQTREDVAGRIVFIPGSAVSAKCWPACSWMSLSAMLGELGLPVSVIGQPQQSSSVAALCSSGLPWIETATLKEALDVVSSCAAVVSVDTGLMHLAVNQGTKTVGIFRPAPVYIRQKPHFIEVVSPVLCAEACYRKESDSAHHHLPKAGVDFAPQDWSCLAPLNSCCMYSISPAQVMQALAALSNVKQPACQVKTAGSSTAVGFAAKAAPAGRLR